MFGKLASGIAGATSKAGALGDQFKGATDKAGAMGNKVQGMFGQAGVMGNKVQGMFGQAGAIKTILSEVSNPDKFLAIFAGDNARLKTKYIDDVVTLSTAGNSISQFMPGAPAIPKIDETTKEYINKLVNNDNFKTIISEINTNADLKEKVMSKLSDGQSTVKFASGLMENLQTGNIDGVTAIIKTEFNKIKDESVATTRPYENVKSGDPDAPINDENPPIAYAVNDEKEEEKMRETFQDLIND